jgi:DNA-binding transcriptional ArsR family regulator
MTSSPDRELRVRHLDAAGLRALAHPLRMRIVGSLRLDGPATASGLAERLGVSSGLTSYHLRALAAAEFVEDDPDHPAKGRERWWRAAQDMTSWQPGAAGDDPDAVAAEGWLAGYAARRAMGWIDGWLARRSQDDQAWQAVSGTSDYLVAVTPDELEVLLDQITELVRPHLRSALERAAADPEADAVEGRIDVRLLLQAFPRGPDDD